MKKIALLISAFLLVMAFLPLTVTAGSETMTVYLSEDGSDSGDGTSSAPYATLDKALSEVTSGGTVVIDGTYRAASSFAWQSHGKAVTVTGGTLDLRSLSGELVLEDDVTFTDITLTFDSGDSLYAAGHRLYIDSSVTLTNRITVFGGGKSGTTVASTDVTLLAGSYYGIYGGSRGGTVTGDTHLHVGGTVNAELDVTNHNGAQNVYGGGQGGTVGGTTHVLFDGDAKATYLVGGSQGGTVTKGTDLLFASGSVMSIYGGNRSGSVSGVLHTVITGGTVEQVFGGSDIATVTGDVILKLLGGKITRRVYGGCYNIVSRSGLSFVWGSQHAVVGKITLVIGGDVNISLDANYDDLALYARSRLKPKSGSESSVILYADGTAYSKYHSKIGASDFAMSIIMAGLSATDSEEQHSYVYTVAADGKTVTETCSSCDHTATATLTLDPAVSLIYCGRPISPVVVSYSGNWMGKPPIITYRDNTDVGIGTASASVGGGSISLTFTIGKAPQVSPLLTVTDETVRGKKDGTITGLTVAMEYSTDGSNYTPISDTAMLFPAGTYYVRYTESDHYLASSPATVTVGQGRMLKITFRTEGAPDIVREVEWDGTLTDIPSVPNRAGYTETAPYWNVDDFSHIQSDMTVTAVYVKDAVTTRPAVTTESVTTTAPTTTQVVTTTEPLTTSPITEPVTTAPTVATSEVTEPTASTEPATAEPVVTTAPQSPSVSETIPLPTTTDGPITTTAPQTTTEDTAPLAPEMSVLPMSEAVASSREKRVSWAIWLALLLFILAVGFVSFLLIRKRKH